LIGVERARQLIKGVDFPLWRDQVPYVLPADLEGMVQRAAQARADGIAKRTGTIEMTRVEK
jgi:hypothetical protein